MLSFLWSALSTEGRNSAIYYCLPIGLMSYIYGIGYESDINLLYLSAIFFEIRHFLALENCSVFLPRWCWLLRLRKRQSILLLFVFFLFSFWSLVLLLRRNDSLALRGSDQDSGTIESRKTTRDQKYFFIYEWPEEIVNRWPSNSTHFRLSISERFAENGGVGPLIDRPTGLYHTHQYSLFRTLLLRMLESPLRTRNPNKASFFFVPYDLGMDSSTRQSDGALTKTDCPLMPAVKSLLLESPYFQRKFGADHFILHSINQMMTFYTHLHCLSLYELCFNCTKLSIDVYSRDMYSLINEHSFMRNKWISIPFPSNYHVSDDTSMPPWMSLPADYMSKSSRAEQSQTRKISSSAGRLTGRSVREPSRPYAIAFMASMIVTARLQKSLRQVLQRECTARPTECLFISLESHDSMTPIFNFNATTGNSSFDGKTTISSPLSSSWSTSGVAAARIMAQRTHQDASQHARSKAAPSPYSLAKFCLMPGGDFPTRKGVLDALLSGCIPVTFQLASAQLQWTWHWGSIEAAMNCTIYIPRKEVLSPGNASAVFQHLIDLSHDSSLLLHKRRAIAAVGHRLQYNVPRVRFDEYNISRSIAMFPPTPLRSPAGEWGRRREDAVDVLLRNLLGSS